MRSCDKKNTGSSAGNDQKSHKIKTSVERTLEQNLFAGHQCKGSAIKWLLPSDS